MKYYALINFQDDSTDALIQLEKDYPELSFNPSGDKSKEVEVSGEYWEVKNFSIMYLIINGATRDEAEIATYLRVKA